MLVGTAGLSMGQNPNQSMSDEEKDPIESLFSRLRRQRDELKLKMHLAGKEAQDQFAQVEEKWKEVEHRAEPLTGAVKEATSTVGEQARKVTAAAMDLAAREIKDGYEKLRKLLD